MDLQEIYYDPENNISSLDTFYNTVRRLEREKLKLKPGEDIRKAAKKQGEKLTTRAELKQFMDNQAAYQRTKTFAKKKKFFNSIIAPRPGSNLQIDFMFLRNPYTLREKGKKIDQVLHVVDIHSRRAWAFPLPSREAKLHVPILRKLFDQINAHGLAKREEALDNLSIGKRKKLKGRDRDFFLQTVRSLNSDKEFLSDAFQDLLREYQINHYASEVDDFAKNAIVERFNRTMRRIMLVDREKRDRKTFTTDDYERYIRNYNKQEHSTIRAAPIDVYEYRDTNKQKYKFVDDFLSVGEKVRTLDKKALFEKGTYEYSDKIYTITRIGRAAPTADNREETTTGSGKRYFLDDDKKRSYMGYELLKVGVAQEAPGYDITLAEANNDAQIQEAQQDLLDKRLRRELGEEYDKQVQRSPRGAR